MDLVAIGSFARLSGLTVRAVRHYGELGLLEPAWIDEESGYRYYALIQTRRAEAIRSLRALEVPLEEIRLLLEATPDEMRDRLVAHRSRLEGRLVELREVVEELTALIDGRETLVQTPEHVMIRFELEVGEMPEVRGLAVHARVPLDDLSRFIPSAIDEVHALLRERDVGFSGPPFCVSGSPDDDGLLDVKVGWPVDRPVDGRGRMAPITVPGGRALSLTHRGPYETRGNAYRLLSEVVEANGLTPVADPIEIYTTGPAETPDPRDHVTRIYWPIGPEGEVRPTDHFERRVPAPD